MTAAKSPESFEIAQTYCRLHAAAVCLGVEQNGVAGGVPLDAWAEIALHRLGLAGQPPESAYDRLAKSLIEHHDGNRLFSLRSVPLAT